MVLKVEIAQRYAETADIVTLELVDPRGRLLPAFDAGAHIDLYIPNGLIRQYSIWNTTKDRGRYCISVLKEPQGRGGSVAIHENLCVGTSVQISEPRNNFPLSNNAQRVLLVAGGIGITPIYCMAQQLLDERRDFELHFCARSQEKAAFLSRLEALGSLRARCHFDDGPAEQRLSFEELFSRQPAGTEVYVCGPEGMIDAVTRTAENSARELIVKREYFRPPTQTKIAAGSSAFDIELRRSGLVLSVPSDKSILEVIEEHGIDVPSSCREGVCGTCFTRVLEGIPDHRDEIMTSKERSANDKMAICCSRSKSDRLVLDL